MPIPRDQVRDCPGCRQERHRTHFIKDSPYCAICRECGPQFPIEGATGPEGPLARRGTMPTGKMEKRACAKGCGKMLDPRGAHKHEGTCPGVQGGGSARSLPARRGARSAERKAHGDGKDQAAATVGADRITVELQAMMDELQRAIELVGLAARRIEGRQG